MAQAKPERRNASVLCSTRIRSAHLREVARATGVEHGALVGEEIVGMARYESVSCEEAEFALLIQASTAALRPVCSCVRWTIQRRCPLHRGEALRSRQAPPGDMRPLTSHRTCRDQEQEERLCQIQWAPTLLNSRRS
jgi:hypothetical protein